MAPEHSLACVVTFWHVERQQPMFQIYHGLLFGLPNAVTSFNRWSRLAEALVRRLLFCLYSMYYDDANFQDWRSTGKCCQQQIPQAPLTWGRGDWVCGMCSLPPRFMSRCAKYE